MNRCKVRFNYLVFFLLSGRIWFGGLGAGHFLRLARRYFPAVTRSVHRIAGTEKNQGDSG